MEYVPEDELIDCIRQYKVIYDHNCAGFKDKDKKHSAWEEVAQKCHSRISDCQRRYSSVRTTLSRYLKSVRPHTNSKLDDDVTLDAKYGHLQWLVPYIKPRPNPITKEVSETSAACERSRTEEDSLEELITSSHASICDDNFEVWQVSNDKPAITLDKHKKQDSHYPRGKLVRSLKRINNTSQGSEDDCGHFCSSLAAKMRKLSPYCQLLAQQKILSVMMEIGFNQEPQSRQTVNSDEPTLSHLSPK